ncbi:RHS repeat-associated core domain-containing protein [Rubellicoccus peritrichatus]|uniref:RHS repeat-associated core domain-containing protein n=1 Tax=Rubellicoccus peritrichatus TaxID=3080537 RepID=A0AAQ3L8A6_9BACT|nr:RHS repeat-associated core domain-containing protein [Puniceicoccus sp. CR14]WOO41504.1 RHS repeat-associated core domain-containing protein [Puniceicoccus sp. CR14]
MNFLKLCTLSGLILAGLFNAVSSSHAAEVKVSVVTDIWKNGSDDRFKVIYKRVDDSSWIELTNTQPEFSEITHVVDKNIEYLEAGHEYEFRVVPEWRHSAQTFYRIRVDPPYEPSIKLKSFDPNYEIAYRGGSGDYRMSGWLQGMNHQSPTSFYVKLVPRSSFGSTAGAGATPGAALRTPTLSQVASDFGGDFNGVGGLNFGHKNTGVYLEMALGEQVAGDSAGSLIIQAHYINHLFDDLDESIVYAPPLTRFADTIEVLRNPDASISQILTPEAKVDISNYIDSGNEYITIRVFENTVGSSLPFDPDITASSELRRWDIYRPDGSLNDLDVTFIEYDGNGNVIQSETSTFYRNITGGYWTYTTGGGLYNEKISRSVVGTITTLTKEVWQATNTTDKVTTVHKFEDLDWGPELIERTVDSGGENLTTQYRYYESTLDAEEYRYGELRDIRYPDGNWVNYEYHKDVKKYGMVRYIERPWLGAPGTPGLISPVDVGSSYANNSAQVTEIEWDELKYEYAPGEISTWTAGTKSSRTQFGNAENTITLDGTTIETRRTTVSEYAGAPPTAPVISETILYETEKPAVLHLNGRPRVICNPDGSQISFTAKAGTISGNAFSNSATGEDTVEYYIHGVDPDLGLAAGVHESAWKGNDIEDIRLVPGKSTVQELRIDEKGRVLYEFTSVFTTASAWEEAGWKKHTYNERGQLTETEHSTLLFEYYDYDVRDRLSKYTATDGSVTEYDYDALDRVTEIRRKGVTNATYGNQADVVTTIAYDTIATSGFGGKRTITTTAGSQTTTATEIYDPAGRLISSTNGIGLTTTIDYPLGGRNQEITYDDGTTRNLFRHINGMNKWLKGTSLPDSSFTYTIQTDGYLKTSTYPDAEPLRKVEQIYDWMGRLVTEKTPAPNPEPGTPTELTTTYNYNDKGQLAVVTPTATNATLYGYGYMGNLQIVSFDVNGNLADDDNGTDRVRIFDYGFYKDVDVIRHYATETTRPKLNSTLTKEIRKTTTRVHPFDPGLNSEVWQTDINGHSIVTTSNIDAANKRVDITTNYPDATQNGIAKLLNGRLVENRTMDNLVYSYKYDDLGNLKETVDPRTGSSYIRYHSNHLQVMEEENAAGDIVAYTYETDTGRLASVKDPLGQYSYLSYNDFGQLERRWGGNSYPVEIGYNAIGDRTTMKTYKEGSGWTGATWPASVGTAGTTTWTIDMATGVPYEVEDPLGKKTTTTFDSGRIKKITPARTGHDITYVYDADTGDLTNVNYASASTPDITFSAYNRLGLPETVDDASGVRGFGYDLDGDLSLLWERLAPEFGSVRYLNRQYEVDSISTVKGRYRALSFHDTLNVQSTNSYRQVYEYEASSGRIDTIAGSKTGFTAKSDYNYRTDSTLLDQLTVTNGIGTTYQTINYGYEPTRNLLSFVQHKNGSNVNLSRFDYQYDKPGRRTSGYGTGKHFEDYPRLGLLRTNGYNDRSEVTDVVEHFANSITDQDFAIRGRVWDFAYDNAGNRTSMNGDAFTNNVANQLTQRVVSGKVSASGLASATSPYSVDRITLKATTGSNVDNYVTIEQIESSSTQFQPARRYENFFYADIEMDNRPAPTGSGSMYATLSVFATDKDLNTVAPASPAGHQFIPETPETITYDDDGNLQSDGRWFYTYDSENRLITMETRAVAHSVGVPQRKLEFGYDYLGRRFSKKVYHHDGSSFPLTPTHSTLFVYDGWNLIAELDALAGNAIIKRYYWGLDLSGTDGGAGGAGGLYAMVDNTTGTERHYFAQYDGNGNLVGWSDTSGDVAATYEYSPFGEMLAERYAVIDPNANPPTTHQPMLGRSGFRFSTNYYDAETGMYYYGYRYYNPQMGRFINRDPIGFAGGTNLYGFVGNNTPNAVDVRGLTSVTIITDGGGNSSGVVTTPGNGNGNGSGNGSGHNAPGGHGGGGGGGGGPTSYIETLDTFSFNNIGSFADTSTVVNDLGPDYLAETAQRGFIGHLMFRAIRGLDSFGRNRTAAGDRYPALTLAMHVAPGFSGGYFGARDFENGRPISGTFNFAFAAFEAAPLGKAASGLRFAAPRVPSLNFSGARNLFDEPIRFFDIQLTPQMGFGVMPQGTKSAISRLPNDAEFITRRFENTVHIDFLSRSNFATGVFTATFDPASKDLFINVVKSDLKKSGVGTRFFELAIEEFGNVRSISGNLKLDNFDVYKLRGLDATPAFKIRHQLGFTEIEEVIEGTDRVFLKTSRSSN